MFDDIVTTKRSLYRGLRKIRISSSYVPILHRLSIYTFFIFYIVFSTKLLFCIVKKKMGNTPRYSPRDDDRSKKKKFIIYQSRFLRLSPGFA